MIKKIIFIVFLLLILSLIYLIKVNSLIGMFSHTGNRELIRESFHEPAAELSLTPDENDALDDSKVIKKSIKKISPISLKYKLGLSKTSFYLPYLPGLKDVLADYQELLYSNPNIIKNMVWEDSSNLGAYAIINRRNKMQSLTEHIIMLESGFRLPLYRAPRPLGSFLNSHYPSARFNETTAWEMYVSKIAMSLYVERNQLVNWSIANYTDNELALLFDGRNFINYDRPVNKYYFWPNIEPGGGIAAFVDYNPQIKLDFLHRNNIIKPMQRETIYSLTEWMSNNLQHNSVDEDPIIISAFGGEAPIEFILGHSNTLHITPKGCWSTSALFSSLLSTVNIPVAIGRSLRSSRGPHARPEFPTVGIALAHGDDPYNPFFRRVPQAIPIGKLFKNLTEIGRYNTGLRNYSRDNVQLALEYMPYSFISTCADSVLNSSNTRQCTDEFSKIFNSSEILNIKKRIRTELTIIGHGDLRAGAQVVNQWNEDSVGYLGEDYSCRYPVLQVCNIRDGERCISGNCSTYCDPETVPCYYGFECSKKGCILSSAKSLS